MRIRIFLLTLCCLYSGSALLAQQGLLRARQVDVNAPERGALARSLKDWKVFSLDGLKTSSQASTTELTIDWGSRQMRFAGRHVPVADQQSRIVEIGPGYRREHPFPELLQFRGKGIRMTLGKDFILGEYTEKGRKYIVEQLERFMPGANAAHVVVYDADDVIDQRGANCGTEPQHSQYTDIPANSETTLTANKAQSACRIVDVAVMANSTSFRAHGSSVHETASYIASIYSLTESDYTSAFTDDFRFHITEIVISTSADTDPWLHTDDINRNLNSFANFAITEFKSPHDLSSYWFHTQGFSRGVIGLAYLGFTCNSAGDAAIREFGGSAQVMRCLLSHEIGHNFNMAHDAAGSGFIMAPSINGSKTFSAASKSSFDAFVGSSAAACITGCDATDCERNLVTDVNAAMDPENRALRATWKKTAGSQGYLVRWWERGHNSVMTRTLDSLAEEALLPLDCSDAQFFRVEVAMICTNGRPGTYTGLDVINTALPRIDHEKGLDTICPGSMTILRSNFANGNQWYRDGIPVPGATGQVLSISEPGNYTLMTTSADGCRQVSDELVVLLHPSAQRPMLSADGPTEFCDGGSVMLNSTAAKKFQWLRDGVEIAGELGRSLSVNSSGHYSVRVEGPGTCIMLSDTIRVQANPLPDIPSVIASRGLALCQGDSIQLEVSSISRIQWYRNDSAITGAVNPSYTTTEAGSYRVQITNQFNCSRQSAEQVVSAQASPTKPLLTATGPVTICEGDSVNLQTDATGNMQWLLDGTILANAAGRRNLYADRSGTYQVRLSNDAGCGTTSDAISVSINPAPSQPQIQASGQTAFCTGGMVTLETNATTGIQWFRNGTAISGATGRTLVANQPGNYQIRVSDAQGCVSPGSESIAVSIFETPARPPLNWNGSEFSTLAGFKTYRWLKDGVEIPGANSNTYRPVAAGNYRTAVTDINNCPAESESYPLVISSMQDVVIAGVSVHCFPNPAREAIHIRVTAASLPRRLTASLVDINGRQIGMKNLTIGLNRFETAQLSPGLYLLLVTDGIERQVIKIVKSR